MATTQDNTLGIVAESTYKTFVAPTRFYEMTGESLTWNKQIKQGMGLRVGSRVARAARRTYVAGDGNGDFTVEAVSKGMGLLWQACLGSGVSTLVGGTTYQHNFTLGDTLPSLTTQVGIVQAGGTVDAYSWLGCTVGQWEFDFPNADIASLKTTLDIGDIATAQTYATPSYPTAPTLYQFANGSISTGAITPATTTTMPTAATPTANIRGGTLTVSNALTQDRYNFGGAGRKRQPTVGLRAITGTLEIEYDSTTYRDLILNDGALTLLINYTGAALSTGTEQLSVLVSSVRLEGALPQPNGTDLIRQSVTFTGLDDQINPPVAVYMRTADAVL